VVFSTSKGRESLCPPEVRVQVLSYGGLDLGLSLQHV